MSAPERIGDFQVVRELGRGGMGVVYEARREGDPRRLALKVLPLELADEEALARFQREGELLARVDHPNVVRVHGLDRTATGVVYLVSDLVEGEDLQRRLRTGPLPREDALRIVRDLAGGVERLHAAGILHRDLKPANVILRPDGAPVLLDFGLARDLSVEQLTRTGALLGSPATMAPEQARGAPFRELGPQVDVYGLGAVLFSLLAGGPPFAGSVTQVLLSVLEDEPDWSRIAGLDAGVHAVLRRALAKAPADRHPTAAALVEDLDRLLRDQPISHGRSLAPIVLGVAALGAVGVVAALATRPAPGAGPQAAAASTSPEATPRSASSSAPPSPRPSARTLRRVAALHPLHQPQPIVPDAQLLALDDRTVVTRCHHLLRTTHLVDGAWVGGASGARGRGLTAFAYWGPDHVVFGDEVPGPLRVWNVRTGLKTKQFDLAIDKERRRVATAMAMDRERGVLYVAYSRDGHRPELDPAGWGGVIRVPTRPLGSPRPLMEAMLSDVHDLLVTPDGTLVAVGADRRRRRLGHRQSVCYWRGRWKRLGTVAIHSYHAAFSGGLLACGSSDGYVALWTLGRSRTPSYLGLRRGVAEFGQAYPLRTRTRVALHPGGRWAFTAGASNRETTGPNRIKVWDLRRPEAPIWTAPERRVGYVQLALSPNGRTLFALRRDCVLERWSVAALTRR